MMYPIIPALSFISSALALVPLIWYLQARNIAAMAIGLWLSITSVIYAVDALVWAQDVAIKVPVWCDISTVFITGSRIALPAACLCICIHLARLASFCQTSTGTPQAKRRRVIFEGLMCFGLPVVYMVLHLIVQPRRFNLYYGFGCRPSTFPTDATIFLVMIPPLSLAVMTIVYAGITWRHFLVHGVQFHGKRGSISPLTRNLYLRLVGMALLEASLSAVLIAVSMSYILHSGLIPIGNMSRSLSEILVWGPEAVVNDLNLQRVLGVEWLMTVVQSVAFFGLFSCRTEVIRDGWEWIRSLPGILKGLHPSVNVMLERASESSSASDSVPTLPMTVVDLSVFIESDRALTPCEDWMDEKSFPGMVTMHGSSHRPSTVGGQKGGPSASKAEPEPEPEEVVISAFVPSMEPLESPSRASAFASSHNSLESNFDPSLHDFPPEVWPQTPTSIPTRPRPSQTFSIGCILDPSPKLGESWFGDVWEVPPFARARLAQVFEKRPGRAVYVTVVKETH